MCLQGGGGVWVVEWDVSPYMCVDSGGGRQEGDARATVQTKPYAAPASRPINRPTDITHCVIHPNTQGPIAGLITIGALIVVLAPPLKGAEAEE